MKFTDKNKNTNKLQLHATAVAVCIFTFLFVLCDVALSQAWKQGQASLMKNDFKSAKTQLTAALKKSRPGPELAETYKYLGVANYMLGDKNAATQAFSMAKASHSAVKLNASEVLDESVLVVFNRAKPASPASNQTRSTQASAPRVGGNQPPQTKSSPGITRQRSKRTLLKVVSNAPSAAISIDGINYGAAGQELEVSPGTVILEVAANGFKTKAIKVKLQPLTSSLVNVNLDRIVVPKPKPKVAQPVAHASQSKIPLPGQPQKVAGKNAGGGKNDLFGDDPMADQSFAAPQQPQVMPRTVIPPPAPAQPVMPAQPYMQPPMAYPMAPQYSPYPMYPQYAPMQPYGAPMYPASPYGGYMPPPNPYAYPPTPPPSTYSPAPMADPYGGYLGPPPEASIVEPSAAPMADGPASSGGGMPPPPILPPSKSSPAKPKTAAHDKCGFIRILPFGAGQFCSGSNLKGAAFLGGQIAALYFYRANSTVAASSTQKLNNYIASRAVERQTTSDDLDLFDNETNTTVNEAKKRIGAAKQNATYSIASFAGLWGLGVVDAYINKPGAAKKKKSKKPRIMYSYDLDIDTAPLGTWAISIPNSSIQEQLDPFLEYRLGYTPVRRPIDQSLVHSITLGVSVDL